jgi:hypothetical protein
MSGRNATTRVSDRAGAYAANRPTYPKAAIDALLRGRGAEYDLVVERRHARTSGDSARRALDGRQRSYVETAMNAYVLSADVA